MNLAYSTNAYMKFPLATAIDRIANLGFAGVEIMADVPHAWPQTTGGDEIDRVRRRIEERGLQVSNVNAFMMNAIGDFWHPSWIEPDPARRKLRIEHTIRSLRLARMLGSASISTEPGGPLPDGMLRSEALDIFAAGLDEVLPHAEEQGVRVLVEPEPGLLIENVEQFLTLAERFDSPMFGLNFDVGHFFCVSEPLDQAVARLQRWTAHYHLEDIAATRVHEHLVPGRGAIDFEQLLRAIRMTAYNGWLTIELYPYLDDPDGAGLEALSFLSPILDK